MDLTQAKGTVATLTETKITQEKVTVVTMPYALRIT